MTWQILLEQAVSLHQAGKLAAAERLYEQVLAAEPRSFPAQYQLAFLLYQQQRQPAALRAVEAAVKLNPDARDALVLQSVLLLNAGQLDLALTGISKVTARHPGDTEAWHNRGVILAGLRRHEEALSSFDRALAVQPALVNAHCHRGNVLMDLKRYAEAIAAFDSAVVLAPDLFDGWSNRGLALYEMERFADSAESYDRAVGIRPDYAPAWTNRGKALNGLKRFDDALTSFDRALAIAPDNVEAWYARALVLRTMHRLEDALVCVDRALAIRPESLPSLFSRGWLLCELNRVTEGVAAIERTARQDLETKTANKPPHSTHKQCHDAEQRDYLAARGVPLKDGDLHFVDGSKLAGSAINPDNAQSAAVRWEESRPRIVVIDNLLTDEALEKLRRFCWGSTVWQMSYEGGYLGAMPEQGFACPLLAQIAEELRDIFPTIVGDHRLRMLWGFKYDSRLRGIGIHADQAAVNVNFWITPDTANCNAGNGGMVVWDVAAPQDWDIRKYNGDETAVRAFLDRSGAKPVTVPYRANRAVIFDSDLFHETDTIDFDEGYLNRRINLTMLYGRRTYYGN